MAYFPMFIDLEGKKCLVVGGGRVAARKAVQLLDFGADLLVVAKEASPEMQRLAESGGPDGTAARGQGVDGTAGTGHLRLQLRPASVEDAKGMDLVICASDDRGLHEEIASFCKEHKILVNVADDKEGSSFLFPGLVRQGEVVLGITSGGKSPAAVRYLRGQIEGMLPPYLGGLVERLGALRERIKETVPDPRERERLFTALFFAGIEGEGSSPEDLEKLVREMLETANTAKGGK